MLPSTGARVLTGVPRSVWHTVSQTQYLSTGLAFSYNSSVRGLIMSLWHTFCRISHSFLLPASVLNVWHPQMWTWAANITSVLGGAFSVQRCMLKTQEMLQWLDVSPWLSLCGKVRQCSEPECPWLSPESGHGCERSPGRGGCWAVHAGMGWVARHHFCAVPWGPMFYS